MSASVIILPVIHVERDELVPVQGRVSPNARDALQKLANSHCDGDLAKVVSDLLEHCADIIEGGT